MEIAEPSQKVVLHAHDLSCSINGEPMLRQVSFRLHERHVMCIVGENGSGKSLLLRVLAEDFPASGGRVVKQSGADIFRVTSEDVRAHGLLTVGEFLGASTAAVPDALDMAASTYRLNPNQCVATLSAGEQQRMLLAAAAVAGAKITLFDTPVSALDSSGFDLAEALIRSLTGLGGAVIVATTSPELILRLDDCSLHRLRFGVLEQVRAWAFDLE